MLTLTQKGCGEGLLLACCPDPSTPAPKTAINADALPLVANTINVITGDATLVSTLPTTGTERDVIFAQNQTLHPVEITLSAVVVTTLAPASCSASTMSRTATEP